MVLPPLRLRGATARRTRKMSGKGSSGRGAYGSLAAGDDVDVEEGEQELKWYDQPVRRQNPYFLFVTFAFFASLAVIGVALNAAGVVKFGPGFTKEKPIHGLSICEVDFCGGGVLISEDGIIIDNSERAGWMNPLAVDKLATCSADRDVAGSTFDVILIVQFDNPTGSPVVLSDFSMAFATSDDSVIVECAAVTTPAKINPLGGNRLDVDCKFHSMQVAGLVAAWWNGDSVDLKHWWTGTASVDANANLEALSFSHGEVGDEPIKLTLPPRPSGGPNVYVTPAATGVAETGAFLQSALNFSKHSKLGSGITATMGDDTAAVMIADEKYMKKSTAATGDPDENESTPFGLPVGTKLSDLFDGSAELFPQSDNPKVKNKPKCPGALDLSFASPSLLMCSADVDNEWVKTFRTCANGDGGGELFSTWNSEGCRGLMTGIPLQIRLVVDNPSDVYFTLMQFTPRVWISGRDSAVGEGTIVAETNALAQGKVAIDAYVTIPWESEESFIVDARTWWNGDGLDVKMDANFGAQAMGVGVHVTVPESAYTVWTPDETWVKETVEKTKQRAKDGECSCFAGACQFGSYVPGSGKDTGEPCVLVTQCASKVCGWDFKCE